MAYITGTGAPNKTMRCSVNDKYVDSNTGETYICVFTYHDSMNNATCEWEKIAEVNHVEKEPEVKAESEPEPNDISPEKPAGVNIQVNTKPKYNDYSKQYKKNRN